MIKCVHYWWAYGEVASSLKAPIISLFFAKDSYIRKFMYIYIYIMKNNNVIIMIVIRTIIMIMILITTIIVMIVLIVTLGGLMFSEHKPELLLSMKRWLPSMPSTYIKLPSLTASRYDEDGVPVEVMLIDLQVCRRESFAVDLNYFLYTSLTGDVRKPNLDALLETYRGHFNGVVEAGGAGGEGRLSEVEVVQEFRRLNILGAIFNMMIIGALLMEPEDVPEFVASGDGADDLERVLADFRAKSLEMVDTNPLMRPRFLSVFDELTEAGLIPASGAP